MPGNPPPTRKLVARNLTPDTTYQFGLSNISNDGKSAPAIVTKITEPGYASTWWFSSRLILLGLLALGAALCGAGALWWYSSYGERVAFYSSALALRVLLQALLLPSLTDRTFGI